MYNVCIIDSPIPQDDKDAWRHLFAILGKRDSESDLPPAPVFLRLIDRLVERYPCICDLPEEESDGERALWKDGPLRDNAEHSVTVLSLRSERVDDGLQFVVDVANSLGLVVFDDQQDAIFRPREAPPAPAETRRAKTFAGGSLVSETRVVFCVRITGVAAGRTIEEVARQLAPLFKRTEAEVVALLRQDRPVVKRNVAEDVAAKYRAALEQRGCRCDVELEAIRSGVREVSAEERYRQQAEAGDIDAQLALGNTCYNGSGTGKDAGKAIHWWTRAATQGLPAAQFNLGIAYASGKEVEADTQKAIHWFRAAATQGMADAQNELGVLLEDAAGRDDEAREWYRKAAEQRHVPAQANLGQMYLQAGHYAEAARWLRQAAEQGDPSAQNSLGVLYKNAQGVDRDIDQAIAWLTKAADQGHGPATLNIGNIHFSGQGVERNATEAVKWFLKAVERNQPQAARALGICYDEGMGVGQDKTKALAWFHRSASMGDADAQLRLALRYMQGDGVAQDGDEALRWMRLAAEQGQAEAQHLLGMRYLWGLDVPKNTQAGRSWLEKAAAQGHPAAAKELRKPVVIDETEGTEYSSEIVFSKEETVTSFNGIGRTYYGQRDFEPDGTFVTTKWLIVLFFPILPTSSVRVRVTSSDGPFAKRYEIVEHRPLCWRQVLATYAYAYGVLPSALFLTDRMPNSVQIAALIGAAALPAVLRFFARQRAGA